MSEISVVRATRGKWHVIICEFDGTGERDGIM